MHESPALEDPRVPLEFPDGLGEQGLGVHLPRVEDHPDDVEVVREHGHQGLYRLDLGSELRLLSLSTSKTFLST